MTVSQSQQAHRQIRSRLWDIFSAYLQGNDVSPAQLFRTEGFVQACCVLKLISVDDAFELMAQVYCQVFEQTFKHPKQQVFTIPVCMKRAPVYPST